MGMGYELYLSWCGWFFAFLWLRDLFVIILEGCFYNFSLFSPLLRPSLQGSLKKFLEHIFQLHFFTSCPHFNFEIFKVRVF